MKGFRVWPVFSLYWRSFLRPGSLLGAAVIFAVGMGGAFAWGAAPPDALSLLGASMGSPARRIVFAWGAMMTALWIVAPFYQAAQAIAADREKGFLAMARLTRLSELEIAMGHLAGVLLRPAVALVLSLPLAVYLLFAFKEVSVAGLLKLGLFWSVGGVSFGAVGLMVSSLSGSRQTASNLAAFLLFCAFLLGVKHASFSGASGFLTPAASVGFERFASLNPWLMGRALVSGAELETFTFGGAAISSYWTALACYGLIFLIASSMAARRIADEEGLLLSRLQAVVAFAAVCLFLFALAADPSTYGEWRPMAIEGEPAATLGALLGDVGEVARIWEERRGISAPLIFPVTLMLAASAFALMTAPGSRLRSNYRSAAARGVDRLELMTTHPGAGDAPALAAIAVILYATLRAYFSFLGQPPEGLWFSIREQGIAPMAFAFACCPVILRNIASMLMTQKIGAIKFLVLGCAVSIWLLSYAASYFFMHVAANPAAARIADCLNPFLFARGAVFRIEGEGALPVRAAAAFYALMAAATSLVALAMHAGAPRKERAEPFSPGSFTSR